MELFVLPTLMPSLPKLKGKRVKKLQHLCSNNKPKTARISLGSNAFFCESVRSLFSNLCNAGNDLINRSMNQPLESFIDPNKVLQGNFAPVSECPPTECLAIEGEIPECLQGVYMRNGPNPRFCPRNAYHHFDGDGMVHALTIKKDHRIIFCSRFVCTYKFHQEQISKQPLLPNLFSELRGVAGVARFVLFITKALCGFYDISNGLGLANTSVVFFNNHILALAESGPPYLFTVTRDGDMETLDRVDFNGPKLFNMTAHPKIDHDTGEMFTFSTSFVPPFLKYFRVSPSGERSPDVGIRMTTHSFVHDFAITKKYAVFPDSQIVLDPLHMLFGSPVRHEAAKVARVGIMPRYAKDDREMKWFNTPGFNFIHVINAWDEGDEEVVVIAPNLYPLEHALERTSLLQCTVEKVTFNMRNGIVTRRPLSTLNLEFGVINRRYTGRKNRYAYAAVGGPMPKVSGIVKMDFEKGCVVATRMFGDGVFGGEPFFIARNTDASYEAAEDDGYVVSYTHDESTRVSKFVVMHAQSESLEIVASVELPARVPYGFHGLFIPQSELSTQNYIEFYKVGKP